MKAPLAPLLVPAVLIAGLAAVACSKPGGEAKPQDRNLSLLGASVSDSSVVSALEAGQTQQVPLAVRRPGRSAARHSALGTRQSTLARSAAELEALPKASVSTVATAAAPLAEVPLPAPTTITVAAAGTGTGDAERGAGPSGSSRDPVIIIRGGIGTAHDDCKIGVGRQGGGGIMVNRLAPPLRGRTPTSFVGPVRIR